MAQPLDPATIGTDNLASLARYRPYPDCKDTDVEWLNEVPAHWRVERLKYVATLNDETLSESTDPNFNIAYIDIGSVDPVEGSLEPRSSPSGTRHRAQGGWSDTAM